MRVVLVWILSASVFWAAEPLSLPAAVNQVMTGHPELGAARARIEAATGRAVQARLWPNPELEWSAEDWPVEDGGWSRSKTMLGVAQTVPFPGKKSLEAQIGGQEILAAAAEYRQHEREAIRDVTVAFYTVLVAEKKRAVAAELVTLAQSLAAAARQRVAAGSAADQEQLRAEIELERAQLEATAADQELHAARRTLARWLGVTELPALAGSLPEEVAGGRAPPPQHPRLAKAAANRQRAELELRRAKLEPLPDLTLGIAGGRDRAEDETLLEFRVSLPLPLWDRAQGRKREAQALAEMARYDVADAAQQFALAWDIARQRLVSAQAQTDAYRMRLLPKAEEALRLVRAGYDAGKFGLTDLLDTQRTARETRLAYYDKLLELNTAAAELAALSTE
jgi:cobalt-zinc-cadmium efflux system outer membrane protein